MRHNFKLELFDKLNFLKEVAEKGLNSLPDELSLFLINELEIKGAVLLTENGENRFKVIGKHGLIDNIFTKGTYFSISNYREIINDKIFNNGFTSNCLLDTPTISENLQSLAFGYANNSIGLLILNHKIRPSNDVLEKFYSAAKLIGYFLGIWKNYGGEKSNSTSINFAELVENSSQSFRKIINTINGLTSLISEEQLSDTTSKYINSIKDNSQLLLNSINDLIDISQIEQNKLKVLNEEISLNRFLANSIAKYNKNIDDKIKFIAENDSNLNIKFDKTILEQIITILLSISSSISTNKNVLIKTQKLSSDKIGLSFTTEVKNIDKENINELEKPFILNKFVKDSIDTVSGLSIPLLNKLDTITNIKLNISLLNKNEIILALTIPTGVSEKPKEKIVTLPSSNKEDNKILVIESDKASSALLNNYLAKWDYKTEFVNNGDIALRLLKTNKYVAVILNIDQQNDNSLELLQKIKNNKATQNTPVIVFSIEPEKEKVFLMGAVEYLVKPINYNNLVEILTSYKLRRNSNVLCVDDDKPTLKLVEQAIRTAGFNVTSEYRSELVMDLISDKDIDLAIIDLDMPKLNGFELIKQIKSVERFSKLPIIIYTGKEDYQEDLEKIDGMFVELLDKKSTSFNELEKAISDMIKSYEEPKPVAEQEINTTGPKILMAEDYKHSQIIVTRLLKKNGFENITVVENGAEALRICENEKIDLILMDMQMPVMNGFEATGEIRELEGYEDTPIIALTAFAMKGDREKCLEAGATDYIAKPIDSKEFIEKVKYYSQTKVNS